jgi:hypothetical protein
MQVKPGPCDSPAVIRRSATAPSLLAGPQGLDVAPAWAGYFLAAGTPSPAGTRMPCWGE